MLVMLNRFQWYAELTFIAAKKTITITKRIVLLS